MCSVWRKTISILHISTIGIPYCLLLFVVFGSSTAHNATRIRRNAQNKTKHRTIFSIWLVVLLLFLLFKLNSGAFLQAEKQFFRLTEVENRQMRERKKHTHIYIFTTNEQLVSKRRNEKSMHSYVQLKKLYPQII